VDGQAAATDRFRAGLPGRPQPILGFNSEARWLRYANAHLGSMFPYLPQQSGHNKRLRAALPLVKKALRMLAADTDFWMG
jgi:hypothetical protein